MRAPHPPTAKQIAEAEWAKATEYCFKICTVHQGAVFRLRRRYPRPAPDKRACRSSGGVSKWGRSRALPVADTASDKEWQRSKKSSDCVATTFFGHRNRIITWRSRVGNVQLNIVCFSFIALTYTERYRSGHNEAVLKTVCLTAQGFESLPLRQKNRMNPNAGSFGSLF